MSLEVLNSKQIRDLIRKSGLEGEPNVVRVQVNMKRVIAVFINLHLRPRHQQQARAKKNVRWGREPQLHWWRGSNLLTTTAGQESLKFNASCFRFEKRFWLLSAITDQWREVV